MKQYQPGTLGASRLHSGLHEQCDVGLEKSPSAAGRRTAKLCVNRGGVSAALGEITASNRSP